MCKPRRKIGLKGVGFQDLACFRNDVGEFFDMELSEKANVAFLFLERKILRHTICAKIRNNASCRIMVGIMPLPDPCYLCRLLCPAKSRPSPLITVNDTICQMCLDTFPQAGDLVDTFHLPMPVAAERHGLSKHKFRSLYTKRGITKWPYRLLRPPVASGCARRWRSVWSLGTLNPDPGPACTRRALGSHLPEIARLFPA